MEKIKKMIRDVNTINNSMNQYGALCPSIRISDKEHKAILKADIKKKKRRKAVQKSRRKNRIK